MLSQSVIKVMLETVDTLMERADCALLPGMVDAPTAKDEVKQAKHLLSVLMDNLED